MDFSVHARLLGALLLSGAATANAATLSVTTTTDSFDGVCDAHCSLRDAIAVANQSVDPDRILLPSGIHLLSLPPESDENGAPVDEDGNLNGDLDITSDLLIQGAGTLHSSISGQTFDRLLEVMPGVRVTLERLTLEGGNTAYNGGAVENHGRLLINQTLLQHNRAAARPRDAAPPSEETFSYGQGGAIANYGELAVLASRFQENSADDFADNSRGRGGAIFNHGTLLVRDNIFLRNRVDGHGDNGIGGALYNSGSATLERTAFVHNQASELGIGGAIANAGGLLKLINSTLSGNSSGALANGLRYATPAGPARALLSNVTVTNNSAIGVTNAGELRIRNSIIAGNYDPYGEQPSNCFTGGPGASYQAIGLLLNDEQGNCSADLYLPYEQTFTQLLFPLTGQDNKTWYHALRPGALAVDAGIGSCPNHDQNGMPRPQDGDGDGVAVCDLGAYELSAQ